MSPGRTNRRPSASTFERPWRTGQACIGSSNMVERDARGRLVGGITFITLGGN
jgi:hypothetical protein